MNDPHFEMIVRERIAEMEALPARKALRRSLRAPRPPLRVRLGTLLIRLGERLRGRAGEAAGDAGPVSAPRRTRCPA